MTNLLQPTPALEQDRFFQTDHLMTDLKGRSVRGGAVTLTAQAVKFLLHTGSTMVLARLLTPADFGLVAMVTVVMGFVAMFKDAGLSAATIQREHITHAQVSTLFWINVALSLAVMAVVAALAPAIAWFYSEPRLVWITLALAATFIFGGLTVQHEALLRRQMRFTALATIEIGSLAAGIATAILMAWQGFGYWALVGLTVGNTLGYCALVWTMSKWRPGMPRRRTGVRPMLGFGGYLTGFSVMHYFARNGDNLVIGWYWGPASLGLYSKAYGLLMMPLQNINRPILAVIMPALSRLNEDPVRYRRAYTKVLRMIALVTIPFVAILIPSADLLIDLVLGSQWADAAPVFIWLGLAGLVMPIGNTFGALLVSQGRAKDQFKLGAINAVCTTSVFFLAVPYGIEFLAASYALYQLTIPILTWTWLTRRGPVRARDLGSALLLPLVVAVLAMASIFGSRRLALVGAPWADWSLGVLAWVLLTVGLLLGTNRGRELCFEIAELRILAPWVTKMFGSRSLRTRVNSS